MSAMLDRTHRCDWARSIAARRSAKCSKHQQLNVFYQKYNCRMSETSFKIKCSKSSSARRFSLSKPTIASLCSHAEASWGASGPSFWYVDDDGDRIEVLDDNDFQAAINQLKSSCVSLNVDFVSDQIEFKSNKNDDVASSASASSEFSHDDDGFISVELHGDSPVEASSPPVVTTDVSMSSANAEKYTQETHEHVLDREGLVSEHHQESFDSGDLETERQDQGQHAADLVYHHRIAIAIEEMVTSSGTGFTRDSFRAAVASSDAASLKLMIRNALLTSSCLSEVQQIAHTAMKRIERSMHNSLHAAPETAATGRREKMVATKLERLLKTRPSAEQLQQAHIIVDPSEARDAALERSLIAQRLENDLAARNKVASRFAGCVSPAHALRDTSSDVYAFQCEREQTMREMQRAQVAATIERNLVARHSLRELKKAHIFVAPVEARAAALERTMTAQRLEKDLLRNRVAPRHAGYSWSGRASVAPKEESVSIQLGCERVDQHSEFGKPSSLWVSSASSEDLQRYETCSAALASMGFDQTEDLRRAIVTHDCNIDVIVQHIFG
jgi:hypothetical protein